jgi:hypothetical protein
VLIGHYVVLVFRVDGLQVRRHVDVVGGQLVLAKVLEQVGVARLLHVDVGEGGVFVLLGGGKGVSGMTVESEELGLGRERAS